MWLGIGRKDQIVIAVMRLVAKHTSEAVGGVMENIGIRIRSSLSYALLCCFVCGPTMRNGKFSFTGGTKDQFRGL